MKNKELLEKVANKSGHSIETVNYVVNQMYKTIDQVVRDMEHVNIKLPGFANIQLSETKINKLLENAYLPLLEEKADDEEFIKRVEKLQKAKKVVEAHREKYTRNRPKRFKG